MRGMNISTGESLSSVDHLKQSITNILTTPIGSRVMRRDYGSNLFSRIDNPMNGDLIAEIYADVYDALDKCEPGFKLEQIGISHVQQGFLSLTLSGLYLPEGKSDESQFITIDGIDLQSG